MEKKVINNEDLNFDNVNKYLNDIYEDIFRLWRSGLVNSEGSDLLADCLDGAPEGVIGVQLLMGYLDGSIYSIVEDPVTGERENMYEMSQKILKLFMNWLIN